MHETLNLKLPFLMQGQINKDITHNEALILIDAVLNSSLKSLNKFSKPPTNLKEGELILISETSEGNFQNFPSHLAFYNNGWRFILPKEGFYIWVSDIKRMCVYNGKNFVPALSLNEEEIAPSSESLNQNEIKLLEDRIKSLENMLENFSIKAIGINTQPDYINNKLTVKSDFSLFTSETGDVKINVNKNFPSSTSSFIFQTEWKGKAEFGLVGGNNFILKVSDDGINWIEVFEVNVKDGNINFKQDILKNGEKIL
jgi:hypothetical protein